jgi:ankyrin repeat protein
LESRSHAGLCLLLCYFICSCRYFVEIIALLSKDWLNAILTESGAVYLAAVLEYVSAELLELSGNSARNQNSMCISPRNIHLAISGDPELLQILDGVVIREAGGPAVVSARIPIDNFVNSATMSPLFGPAGTMENGDCAVDPLSGFVVHNHENNLFRSLDEFGSCETRQQRKTSALQSYDISKFATELPMEATLASLEALNVDALLQRLNWHQTFANQSTQFCIERRHFHRVIRDYCEKEAMGFIPILTHEAMNILQTAVENNLVEIISAANAIKPNSVTVTADDIAKAQQSLELWLCCQRDDVVGINKCVEQGANIEIIYRGCTPLITACQCNSVNVVKRLIDVGADINHFCLNTALNIAIKEGHNEVMSFLLEKGAAVDATASGSVAPLLTAILEGNVIAVSELVRWGADTNVADKHEGSALHVACTRQTLAHLEIAEILICNGCNTEALDRNGLTAISLLKNEIDRDRFGALKQMVDIPALK